MKITLTSQDTINIDIQLDKDSITHASSNYDIITLTAQLAEQLKDHLVILHNAKKQAETERVEQEKAAAKKRRRFSNFTEDVSTTQVPQNSKNSVTLAIVQKRLEQDGLTMNSGLPEIVRFRNTPYAYTVKSNEWTSPLGATGVAASDFLADVAKNIYKMNDTDVAAFVLKYSR